MKRLNGQFAVAIWDSVKQELFIARDRLGVRPLFYCLQTGAFVFGSEIKALAVHPVVNLQINPVALDQVATIWSCLAPGTVFRGINQLPAGYYALISREGFARKRYWQPFVDGFDGEPRSLNKAASEEHLVEIFRELLADSTQTCLLADVPVGAYLSGESWIRRSSRRLFVDMLPGVSIPSRSRSLTPHTMRAKPSDEWHGTWAPIMRCWRPALRTSARCSPRSSGIVGGYPPVAHCTGTYVPFIPARASVRIQSRAYRVKVPMNYSGRL